MVGHVCITLQPLVVCTELNIVSSASTLVVPEVVKTIMASLLTNWLPGILTKTSMFMKVVVVMVVILAVKEIIVTAMIPHVCLAVETNAKMTLACASVVRIIPVLAMMQVVATPLLKRFHTAEDLVANAATTTALWLVPLLLTMVKVSNAMTTTVGALGLPATAAEM